MARLLRMPEVAANTLEATLSEWLLTEDAEFADGDAIATVETDKAAVEVPAEGAGVLVRTLAPSVSQSSEARSSHRRSMTSASTPVSSTAASASATIDR